MQTWLYRIASLYLLWYVVVFALVMADASQPFLLDDVRNVLARYPYAYDFELLFTVLFAIWGAFLWGADRLKDARFIAFTSWAFLAQGVATIILAFTLEKDFIHLLTDSIPWLVLGVALLATRAK